MVNAWRLPVQRADLEAGEGLRDGPPPVDDEGNPDIEDKSREEIGNEGGSPAGIADGVRRFPVSFEQAAVRKRLVVPDIDPDVLVNLQDGIMDDGIILDRRLVAVTAIEVKGDALGRRGRKDHRPVCSRFEAESPFFERKEAVVMLFERKRQVRGIGIEKGEESQIFRRFYRGRRVTVQEGFGIGLYLAREIINLHGGFVTTKRMNPGLLIEANLPL